MPNAILGISAYYHDSAAALLVDGKIMAAAHEERFTRKKHDSDFPTNAVRYVLEEGGMGLDDLQAVAFYDKPYLKFERLLETYHAFAPSGLASFLKAIPVWVKEKMFMRQLLKKQLGAFGTNVPRLLFPEHHVSHAASAFYPSPFDDAAILTVDGVGEWATTTIGKGEGNTLTMLRENMFPHSLGLLYSAFTYYCGFKVNSGEYKLMGLAPYGNPGSEQTKALRDAILDELIDIRDDGSLLLNMDFFRFATGLRMTDDNRFEKLLGIPRRTPEAALGQAHMNLAFAIQSVAEDVVMRLAHTARDLTGNTRLVMAGGVALNCVANGKLQRSGLFDAIWIQPAAGDAGGALGAAYAAWHLWSGEPRNTPDGRTDSMQGSYLGPEFHDQDIVHMTRRYQAVATRYDSFSELCEHVAGELEACHVVGWFQGRMEWGPRALGNRSILGDPRNASMQKVLNLKIKYREGFRPFAPSVLTEDADEYFELGGCPSPYMLLVAPVRDARLLPLPDDYADREMYDRLYVQRSDIPAVTHVDNSARIQTVHKETNPKYHALIEAFKQRTGCGLVVNTSFNVRGEPIVCTPDDAYRCFMRTEMDVLVLGNHVFQKADQPTWADRDDWQEEFELD